MIASYLKRALQDLRNHGFLNAITIITTGLSILIASGFVLFFINASDVVDSWKKGMRIMAYLKPGVSEQAIDEVRQKLQSTQNIKSSEFIPKDTALTLLKQQMRRQSSLFDNLRENPLPDAFEIRLSPTITNATEIETVAKEIESLPVVEEVEYGQRWLSQFTNVVDLFKLAGYTLISLFGVAALFIIANTIRLILYSRREEIDVMRLVGATDHFIKVPFYIQGIIQGVLGGVGGLCVLFVTFLFISSNFDQGITAGLSRIRFLPPFLSIGIVLCSMFIGWVGCFLSLKQFLKS